MDIVFSFSIFIGAMIVCLKTGHSTIYALIIGLILFIITGMRRGFSISETLDMGFSGVKSARIVILVMLIIGMITGIWRSSGTIAFFVYYGIKAITPSLFLLVAFLLSSILSYALGTSFGVAATVGVIFMTLARTGHVNPVITAGVIMSGVYFGDRNSPVSSSAILVAGITGTDIIENVKKLLKIGVVPFLLTTIIYLYLSIKNPIYSVDENFQNMIKSQYNLSVLAGVPAFIMLILPIFKVKVRRAMEVSIVSAILVSYFLQKQSIFKIVQSLFLGYSSNGPLASLMNGGGIKSMLEVVVIVMISSMYSGIFEGTGMLNGIQDSVRKISDKCGRFTSVILTSIITISIFCNQTIAIMMVNDINRKCYGTEKRENFKKAMDMENSVVVLAGLIPWSIASTVPLKFMGGDYRSLVYASFLYLIPIWYWIRNYKY